MPVMELAVACLIDIDSAWHDVCVGLAEGHGEKPFTKLV